LKPTITLPELRAAKRRICMSNMQHITRIMAVAIALFSVGFAAPAFALDAHVGTWKENIAKSTFTPAPSGPAPMSVTRTYETFGDGLKATLTTVRADGKSSSSNWSAHFDGKDYPFVGTPAVDTIALKRIDASTFTAELKKAGKVVQSVRNVASPDGKTITVTQKGTDAQGQPYTGVLVFEKQ
jgi:hypothetical protein